MVLRVGAGGPRAVAHAVIFGEVGRGFGWGDDVVCGESVPSGGEVHGEDVVPVRLHGLENAGPGGFDGGVQTGDVVVERNADAKGLMGWKRRSGRAA